MENFDKKLIAQLSRSRVGHVFISHRRKVKKLIVSAAIAGAISPSVATYLIRQLDLEAL